MPEEVNFYSSVSLVAAAFRSSHPTADAGEHRLALAQAPSSLYLRTPLAPSWLGIYTHNINYESKYLTQASLELWGNRPLTPLSHTSRLWPSP